MGHLTFSQLTFDDLQGWSADDHVAALTVYAQSYHACVENGDLPRPDTAGDQNSARRFFETYFTPTLIENGQTMLFTGYYEPEFLGSRTRVGAYQFPIHSTPTDQIEGETGFSRREIEEQNVLDHQRLEIAWLCDPVDKYFLQIQGSGKILLQDGTVMRVGFAAKNGHCYTSGGKLLLAKGESTPENISSDAIRQWVNDNPSDGRELFWKNESYVFFKELTDLPVDKGPIGTTNISITELRTIAVDPDFVPLGLPVWIEKDGLRPLNRLMIAQDTGSAIKGPQRADIFFGSGNVAGDLAGETNDGGRMVVLMPKQVVAAQMNGRV